VCVCVARACTCVWCGVHVAAKMIYFRTSSYHNSALLSNPTIVQRTQNEHLRGLSDCLISKSNQCPLHYKPWTRWQRIFSWTSSQAACLTFKLATHIQGVQHPTMGFSEAEKGTSVFDQWEQ